MKFYKIIFLFFVISFGHSQEISGIVIDSLNNEPIPFAAIISNFDNNTITNEEGRFRIFKSTSFTNQDSLFISSIGFNSLSLALNEKYKIQIVLSAKVIQLKSVEVRNRKKMTAIQIIDKVKNNVKNVYDFDYSSKKIFWRETIIGETTEIDLKIKKSSIKEFDQKFMDSITSTIPKKSNFYIETLSEFYGNRNPEKQKINAIKSAQLLNKESQISLDLLEKKIQPIVELRIKPDSYFKFKSGIFPVDLSVDGVDLRAIDSTDVSRLEKIKNKKLDERKNFNLTNRNFIREMSNYYIDFKKKKLNLEVFNKSRMYDFILLELSYLGDEPVYIIDYFPRSSKVKYKGRIYIHADDFALIRYDYQSIEPLRDFNLFGVSFKLENRHGTRIFKKNYNKKYDLYFSENFIQRSFGLDRPLKIIEKNKNVRGRRKQNQLNMNINFNANAKVKTEFIVLNYLDLKKNDFDLYKEIESDIPFELIEYDPEFWKGYNIIEPSQAIKEFKIEKN